MKELKGVFAAIATPFTEDGSVDVARLQEHVDFLIESGVHGLVPCGSTGEFAAMSIEERKLVTETVAKQAAGRVLLIPHTGAPRTSDAIELTKHAGSLGADAVLVVQPYYEPPRREDIIQYFVSVAEEGGVPVLAYNLPGVTGFNMDREFYEELLTHTDKIVGVKDTSGDMDQAMNLLTNLQGRLQVLIGQDTIVLPAFAMGCQGTIWGAANFAPKQCVAVYEKATSGALDEAREIYGKLWNVLDFLNREGYAYGVKGACKEVGIDLGPLRRPFGTLPGEAVERLRGLLREAELI